MIPRDLTSSVLQSTPPKAVIIYGPRQAGKTTLIKNLPNLGTVNFLNGDRPRDVSRLQNLESAGDIDVFLSNSDTIIIGKQLLTEVRSLIVTSQARLNIRSWFTSALGLSAGNPNHADSGRC